MINNIERGLDQACGHLDARKNGGSSNPVVSISGGEEGGTTKNQG